MLFAIDDIVAALIWSNSPWDYSSCYMYGNMKAMVTEPNAYTPNYFQDHTLICLSTWYTGCSSAFSFLFYIPIIDIFLCPVLPWQLHVIQTQWVLYKMIQRIMYTVNDATGWLLNYDRNPSMRNCINRGVASRSDQLKML